MKSFGERIADTLLADGLLTQEQLTEALELQKKQGGRLLKLLIEKQLVTDQDMMVSMGRCLGASPVTLSKMRVPQDVIDLIPKELAQTYKMVAVARLGKRLFVAMADPLNVLALDDLRRMRANLQIVPLISTEKAVVDFLNNAQTQASGGIDAILKDVDVSDVELAKEGQEEINLDHAERRLPQDGRFRIKLAGREVDLRVSILPTIHGEKIVMRVLDKGNLNMNLDSLGLAPDELQKFKNAIDAPHGMILMTGPTGSGKTSTLYAVLTQLNTTDVNIVTVEDPVEYQMLGVNQVQVKPEIGLTFAGGLRSILRQDPDIVMVGEIRDSETADIAVKAALTGHLVLSTLHTNDAPGAIARMVDMGIEPFLVSSSVLMVCAQRLVRKICPHCKETLTVPPDVITRLSMNHEEVAATTYYRGRGCSRCKDTGFLGRAAILEVLAITDALREQLLHSTSAKAIKDLALTEGLKTLRMAGLEKAKAGLTSL